jgi:hypothetical protein
LICCALIADSVASAAGYYGSSTPLGSPFCSGQCSAGEKLQCAISLPPSHVLLSLVRLLVLFRMSHACDVMCGTSVLLLHCRDPQVQRRTPAQPGPGVQYSKLPRPAAVIFANLFLCLLFTAALVVAALVVVFRPVCRELLLSDRQQLLHHVRLPAEPYQSQWLVCALRL